MGARQIRPTLTERETAMNKKLVTTLAAVAMAFSLAACGNSAKPATEDTEATTQTTTTTDAANVEEDGQNPVMNFIGPYVCDRATVFVECTGKEDAKITVTWADSAIEQSEWTMSGTLNTTDLTVDYTNGVLTRRTFGEDGTVQEETQVYTDGTGRFTFTQDGKLTWDDGKDHVADGLVFEWTNPNVQTTQE